jgi:hypothetical protein
VSSCPRLAGASKIAADGAQLGEERNEVLQGAAEPVDAPGHNHVYFPASDGAVQIVEGGALVAAFRAADAIVLKYLGDAPAGACRGGPEFLILVGRALLTRR